MLRAFALVLLLTAAAPAVEPTLVARVGSDRFRSAGWVQDLVVAPDGGRVLAFNPTALAVFDAATGRPLARWRADDTTEPVLAAGFAGDRVLAFQSLIYQDAYVVRHYHPTSPRPVLDVKLKVSGAMEHAFSPDGRLLAVANPRRVYVYDTHTGREVNRFVTPKRDGNVTAVRFSADGRRLAVAGERNAVRVYDRTTGRELAVLKPKRAIVLFALAPDGNRVTAALDGSGITTLDVLTGVGRTWKATEAVDELFDLGGGRVMTADIAASKFQVFDAATGKLTRQFAIPADTELSLVSGTVVGPDGRTIYSVSDSGGITAWDVATARRRPQSADPVEVDSVLRFHGPNRVGLTPRPGGVGVLTAASAVWDLTTGGRQVLPRAGDDLCELSPSGLWRATCHDFTVTVANAATGKVARTLHLPGDAQVQAVWFRDGDARVCVEATDAVFVWTLGTNRVRRVPVTLHQNQLPSVPSAGRGFAAWVQVPKDELDHAAVLRVFDLDGGRPPFDLRCRIGDAVQFTPDGSRLVRFVVGSPADDGTTAGESSAAVEVYDAATGRLVRTVSVSGWELRAVSPDGRTLLLSRQDGDDGQPTTLSAVELATGRERWRLPPIRDWFLTGAGFSPDGRRVAVATSDGFVRVWAVTDDTPPTAKLWADLAGADAEKAFAAVVALSRGPDVAVPLLQANLPPAMGVDAKAVDGWLRDLDSPAYAVRRTAVRNLRPVTAAARPAMEALLQKTPSPEVRERLTDLLAAAARPSPADVQAIRAVEVLERIGTADAVAVLRAWAAGAAGATLTEEAMGALSRLNGLASGGR